MRGKYFLIGVVVLYVILYFIKPDEIIKSLIFFYKTILKIISIFIIIFILMAIINLYVNKKIVVKYFTKSKRKGWLIAIISGIISMGPMYMWYPLLKDLRKKGVKDKYIATFLYNRAVKPALLPLLIFYFGLTYTIVLTIVMIIISIFQGIVVEKLTKW